MNANTSDTSDNRSDHHVVSINNTNANMDKPTYDLPTLVKLIQPLKNDVFRQTVAAQAGRANSEFSINCDGVLAQRSIVDGSI